ncbi:phosphate ABC transporter ATP-binding protein [Anaerolineales bacterium HSG24]|nr:phosphate ABC transporter ATP-binding protein [Anaerolineales bacterium HSG24]
MHLKLVMTRPVIYQCQNLTQTYNQRTVLQIDFLEIYAGEILALIGPSGAGKTTFLRQLNFLEAPSAGQLRFHNQQVNGSWPPLEIRRQVTTVFQTPVLLNRSVADNLAYGLTLRQIPRSTITARVAKALDQVGLTGLGHVSARTLSGGEAQRVALARALVLHPEVLLLDEPTANLDPYNVKLIEAIITDLNQTNCTTIILITHNIFQAKRLAHRVGLLLDSRLVEVTDVETFFHAPSDARTAAFVQGDVVY